MKPNDGGILSIEEAALIGYRQRMLEIDREIEEIRRRLKKPGRQLYTPAAPVKKRVISPEGRARIAEAQRRRWAAQKKAE